MSVKRRDLIRYFEKNGFHLHREGGNHSIYTDDKKVVPVKRHKQLDRITANELCKQAGLDPKFYPQVYGSVELEPRGEFVVRSFASFTLSYSAGRYGIDDSGAIRVSFRMVGDGGRLQINDPAAPNYVTAGTSCAAKLILDASPYGISARPRNKCLTVRVTGGYLEKGENITIVFGDTIQGSPGLKLQTFAESAFEFKVSVDPCATGHFVPLAESLEIAIVPDEPAAWKAVLPSLRRPGEDFRFGLQS